MSNTDYARSIFERFRQEDFYLSNESLGLFDVTVAMKAMFNSSWFTTDQMNVFVVMGMSDKVSRETVESFSKCAMDYTKSHKKELPKTMKSVTICFSLMISPVIEDEARQWVMQKPPSRFRTFEVPVLLDSRNNTMFYYRKTVGRHSTHYRFLLELIQKYFIGAQTAPKK
ncbi:MAG: hypothetical protein GY941_19270 [Planctomycetes bacterium]|nr:hypothetical protein [Planctomycetota bacterium]